MPLPLLPFMVLANAIQNKAPERSWKKTGFNLNRRINPSFYLQ